MVLLESPELAAALSALSQMEQELKMCIRDSLHLVKDLLLNDRRVGVVENRLFFNRRFPLLLVPDGVGVGLEIDGASRVFPPFQNVNDRVGVPMVRISGFRAGRCVEETGDRP